MEAMGSITINGVRCDFSPGQTILQVANAHGLSIPQYCYHDGLSIVASCRICLGEIWSPNPRAGNALEPYMGGKLMPTCQTVASDGMVVHTDSPKAVANQKSVMEYLLINHPLDCPVCDQAGECLLQDYSFEFGRGVSRFEEDKVKQPKKDLGPHVYLYADRCIMCTRCVRFTREVTGTSELMVLGRGNRNEIDVFPGLALDNELSGNVVDLCPVGALLDKDFLFAQRVWFLKETPSIDGLTSSGDNLSIHHNDNRVHRVKPRENLAVNKWWISDEVRFGWSFVHSPDRLASAFRRQHGVLVESDSPRATREALASLRAGLDAGKRLGIVLSPMLSCEDAWHLAKAALAINPVAVFALGPVPVQGQDRTYPPGDPNGFVVRAEKAPNARGVARVLKGLGLKTVAFEALVKDLASGIGSLILTGNYPSDWAPDALLRALDRKDRPRVLLIDTLRSRLLNHADAVLPGSTWIEKAGTFENASGRLQAFEQAITVEGARAEGQIGLDLLAAATGGSPGLFNAAETRLAMAEAGLPEFADVAVPRVEVRHEAEMVRL